MNINNTKSKIIIMTDQKAPHPGACLAFFVSSFKFSVTSQPQYKKTAVKAKIIKKIGDSKYTYTYKEEKIFKVVVMYLMDYQEGELTPQLEEIDEAAWFLPEKAMELLSFSQDKALLKKALELKEVSS